MKSISRAGAVIAMVLGIPGLSYGQSLELQKLDVGAQSSQGDDAGTTYVGISASLLRKDYPAANPATDPDVTYRIFRVRGEVGYVRKGLTYRMDYYNLELTPVAVSWHQGNEVQDQGGAEFELHGLKLDAIRDDRAGLPDFFLFSVVGGEVHLYSGEDPGDPGNPWSFRAMALLDLFTMGNATYKDGATGYRTHSPNAAPEYQIAGSVGVSFDFARLFYSKKSVKLSYDLGGRLADNGDDTYDDWSHTVRLEAFRRVGIFYQYVGSRGTGFAPEDTPDVVKWQPNQTSTFHRRFGFRVFF